MHTQNAGVAAGGKGRSRKPEVERATSSKSGRGPSESNAKPSLGVGQRRLAARFDQIHFEALQLLAQEKSIPEDLFHLLLGVSAKEMKTILRDGEAGGLWTRRAFLWDEEKQAPEARWVWATEVGVLAGAALEDVFDSATANGKKFSARVRAYLYGPTEVGRERAREVIMTRLYYAKEMPEYTWVSERELSIRHGRGRARIADGAIERGKEIILVEVEQTSSRKSGVERATSSKSGRGPSESSAKSGSSAGQRRLAARFDQIHFEVLQLLGEEKAIPEDLLHLLLGVSARELKTVLRDGEAGGLWKRQAFLWDEERQAPEPRWVWATKVGVFAGAALEDVLDSATANGKTLSARMRTYCYEPTEIGREHARGVIMARLYYAKVMPEYTWVSERELMVRHGRINVRIADGAIERGKEIIPVEFERTKKLPGDVKENLAMLVQMYGSRIDYFCTDETLRLVGRVKSSSKRFEDVRVLDAVEILGVAKREPTRQRLSRVA